MVHARFCTLQACLEGLLTSVLSNQVPYLLIYASDLSLIRRMNQIRLLTFSWCISTLMIEYFLEYNSTTLINFNIGINNLIIDSHRKLVRLCFIFQSVSLNLLDEITGEDNLERSGSIGTIFLFDDDNIVTTTGNGLG